ncbi:T7SS effector LXG polymorphic toxin [Lactovum odontotermitis]
MGLVYNPGEAQAVISRMQKNLDDSQAKVDNLNRATKQAIDTLQGPQLSGRGYSAAEIVLTELVRPSISKASSALERIRSDLDKFKAAVDKAGGEVLDEDKLKQLLEKLKKQRTSMTLQIDSYTHLITAHLGDEDTDLVEMYSDQRQELQDYLPTVEADIKKVEKKLERLYAFCSETGGLFSSSAADFSEIDTCASVIGVVGTGKAWIDNTKKGFKILNSTVQFKKGMMFLDGQKLTKDANGVLKLGRKYFYDPTGGTAKSTKSLYKGKDFDGRFKNGKNLDAAMGVENSYYKQPLKAGVKEFGKSVNPLNDFKEWKGASKLKVGGKFLGVAGTVMTVSTNFAEDVNLSDGLQGEEVKNFAIDTSVDIASGAGAAAAGAAVGSLIVPPLGTVVGAGVGIIANVAINTKFGNPPKSIVDHTKDAIKKGVDDVGKFLSNLFW